MTRQRRNLQEKDFRETNFIRQPPARSLPDLAAFEQMARNDNNGDYRSPSHRPGVQPRSRQLQTKLRRRRQAASDPSWTFAFNIESVLLRECEIADAHYLKFLLTEEVSREKNADPSPSATQSFSIVRLVLRHTIDARTLGHVLIHKSAEPVAKCA
jgi:hypothetical protein